MEELDFEKLGWEDTWVFFILMLIFTGWEIPHSDLLDKQLKRYAELAGIEEPQELEDKKPQG